MAKIALNNQQLVISGDLSFASVPALLSECKTLLQKQQHWVIDFKDVKRSDSAAVAFLLAVLRYAKKSNKNIHFNNLPQQLISLAEIAGVVDFLQQATS